MYVAYPTLYNVGAPAEFSRVEEVTAATRAKEIPGTQPVLDMLSLG